MMDFRELIDPDLASDFAKAVPELKKRFGTVPLEADHEGYGVGANTFRALRTYRKTPSTVYRAWANTQTSASDADILRGALASRNAFVEWHSSTVRSLERQWIKNMGTPLSFAHAHKLVDLYVKWLSKRDHGSARITDGFIHQANAALDSQILGRLNDCLSRALPISRPSMKDIHNQTTYKFCQAAITEFAEANQGTRLLFDEWTWKRGG